MPLSHVVLVLIDGLRADVLRAALQANQVPNIQRLLGPQNQHGYVGHLIAPAPSVTFAAQASLITGAHPNAHDVPGNQFFDRFGVHHNGKPRWFAFDLGETWEVDDAIAVFTRGLAARCLGARTIYERVGSRGWTSAVFGHMYANGADHWDPLPPTLLARLNFRHAPLGATPAEVDQHTVRQALAYLNEHPLPNLLTVYLMGLDYHSHQTGPDEQQAYLAQVVDPLIGHLHAAVDAVRPRSIEPLWVLAADHGQTAVVPDDEHSLRLHFPFEQEIKPLFTALGLDVLDHPGEGSRCDAVMALNGGMAGIYLRQPQHPWHEPPDFQNLVLPLAQRIWEAHRHGNPAPALQHSVAAVLVRSVESEGWHAPYHWLTPEGTVLPLNEAPFPPSWVDPLPRLTALASPLTPDILVVARVEAGYYFGPPHAGVHGGLDAPSSQAALALAWPRANRAAWEPVREAFLRGIQRRTALEGDREPSVADLVHGLEYLWAHT